MSRVAGGSGDDVGMNNPMKQAMELLSDIITFKIMSKMPGMFEKAISEEYSPTHSLESYARLLSPKIVTLGSMSRI